MIHSCLKREFYLIMRNVNYRRRVGEGWVLGFLYHRRLSWLREIGPWWVSLPHTHSSQWASCWVRWVSGANIPARYIGFDAVIKTPSHRMSIQ